MSPRYHLAVLSDIHGNLQALDAVLADIDRRGPVDGMLVAGDIICGPRQTEVLRRVCEIGAVMILGNNESVVLQLADGSAPEYLYSAMQFSFYRWGWQHLGPGQIDILRALPEQRVVELPGAPPIRMVHGSPRRVDESVRPPLLPELLPLFPEPVLVCGHIHQPWQSRLDGRLAFNPGAVTGSPSGRVEATYALLDWEGQQWDVTILGVPYDVDRLRQDYVESGLLDAGPLARLFLINTCTGSNRPGYAFYGYACRLAEEAGFGALPYIPDGIWQRAEEMFPWGEWETY